MKRLVDILAVELKRWPDSLGDAVGQASDGTLHNDMEPLNAEIVRTREKYTMCKNYIMDCVTRAEWQAAVDALNAPKVVEWDKGSLPPIGSVVEWDGCTFAPEEPQEKDLHVGDQVAIIAHLMDGDFEMAAFTFNPKIHNPARGSIWVNQGAYGCFRPIRTAEQVAAEERMAAAYGMCAIAPSLSNVDAIALYDASYRKQVLK